MYTLLLKPLILYAVLSYVTQVGVVDIPYIIYQGLNLHVHVAALDSLIPRTCGRPGNEAR